jgi:hypothetical protein
MEKIEQLNPDRADEINEISMIYGKNENLHLYYKSSDERSVIVAAIQRKKIDGMYLDKKTLISEIKERLSVYTDKTIHIHFSPYIESPVEIVDAEYVTYKMSKYKISIKVLVKALGMTKTDISAMITGNKPIDRSTKAAVYYYFKVQELLRHQ